MGQRINYFKNNFNIEFRELIFDNFFEFRQWYLDYDKSSLEKYNEPFGSEYLKKYLKNSTDFRTDFEQLDKKLIDELTSEFISSYCDITDCKDIFYHFGPNCNKWHYDGSTELITQTGNEDFIRLWDYSIKGRSLKDLGKFESHSNEYSVGFLTFEEHSQLRNLIDQYFGNFEDMKNKYWTEHRKKEYLKGLENNWKNGTYNLGGELKPTSFGLEMILQVLNQIKDSKNDLIIGIE